MRRRALFLGVLVIVLGVGSAGVVPASADNENTIVKVAKGKVHAAQIPTAAGLRTLPQISAGTVSAAQKAPDVDNTDVRADNTAEGSAIDSLGVARESLGCSDRNSDGDVRVNQDCTYRRQAEEIIKYNVKDPNNLVAGQNDSRVGFNHCGFDYSFNGGQTWGDGLPPFWQHINSPQFDGIHTILGGNGTLHTYDAASDPALATDADGRAFFSCVVFDVASDASAVFVTSSPVGAGGSFYNNLPELGPRFVVAEDNNPAVVHDKQFIIADNFANSPNKNNVYITWTVFRQSPQCGSSPNPNNEFRYCSSPIFGSMSTDHAQTWSRPEEISGSADAICFFGNFFDPARNPHACDFDQGSDPIVRPDGSLVVVFNNGNTAATNPNSQQLSVLCKPSGSSTAGTAHMNCGAPGIVGSDVSVGEPQCNFGRGPEECVPGPDIRTNDFPRSAVNRENGNVYATWQDYRNGEYDIQLAMTTDGVHWTDATKDVNPDSGKDHYFPAIDLGTKKGEGDEKKGDHVGVSYYRSGRVPGENTTPTAGFKPGVNPGVAAEASDYDLAGGRGLDTPYDARRISPEFPPPDGNQVGFNGDYSGLIVIGNTAHPIWSDTRNATPPTTPSQGNTHDEDIFTIGIALPDGRGENS
ncbi:MAG TPA: hypothetical protein VF160_13930 [Candidatus Dormibacteraeota bacterium]